MTETDWLPGLVVVVVSGLVGIAMSIRRGASLPRPQATRREELLQQREAAYALLREHSAARVETQEWENERRKLEQSAVGVLRALDAVGDASPVEAPVAPAPARRGAQAVGALWGAGVAALFVGGAVLSSNPGAPRTGVDAVSVAPGPAGDVAASNREAHQLLADGRTMDAYRLGEAVLKADPGNAEAQTHMAVVLVKMGDLGMATKVLDRVLTANPGFEEAETWRAFVAASQPVSAPTAPTEAGR